MFKLILNKSRFYKIKRGQSAKLVQNTLGVPVVGEVYAGKIISLPSCSLTQYKVKVGESYKSIAEKFGVDEAYIKKLNGEASLYPTKIIFLPE